MIDAGFNKRFAFGHKAIALVKGFCGALGMQHHALVASAIVVSDYLKGCVTDRIMKAAIAANIPLGHIPPDEECAKAVLMLLSDYASQVTGALLVFALIVLPPAAAHAACFFATISSRYTTITTPVWMAVPKSAM